MKSRPDSEVFTGIFSDGNYQPPSGFNFDVCGFDQPVMDDPNLDDYNLDERVEEFINAILQEHRFSN